MLLKIAPITVLKLLVCIDDVSEETKKILTSWGDVQKVRVLELRESKNFPFCSLSYFGSHHASRADW
jgi:hypothetical protein